MNEIMEYKAETYSINQTHSVFVDLEGTKLRLRRPKVNIPKRAMWDEPNPNPQFIHQRHFDLEGSRVLLLPAGLVKKRLWSKKYPLCIALAKEGKKTKVKPDSAPQSPTHEAHATKLFNSSSVSQLQGFEVVSEQKCDSSLLYLFARTCHEKELWYRRLVAASKGTPLKNHVLEIKRVTDNSNTKYPRSCSNDSLKHNRQNSNDSLSSISTTASNAEEIQPGYDLKKFSSYMSRLIPRTQGSTPSSPTHGPAAKDSNPNKDGKHAEKSDKTDKAAQGSGISGPKAIVCDTPLIPLNALLGRCFWDFLDDNYWAKIVQEKLQKKLSKIHVSILQQLSAIFSFNLKCLFFLITVAVLKL